MKRRKKKSVDPSGPARSLQDLLDDSSIYEISFENRGQINESVRVSRDVKLQLQGTVLVGLGGPAITVGAGIKLVICGGHVATDVRDSASRASGSLAVPAGWRMSTAIGVEPGGSLKTEGLEILGDVVGSVAGAGEWHLPTFLYWEMPARSRTKLVIHTSVPSAVHVVSEIHGVAATLPTIGPGRVEFDIDVDARDFGSVAMLDGWLRFEGDGLIRRLRLRARLVSASSGPDTQPLQWITDVRNGAQSPVTGVVSSGPEDRVSPDPPPKDPASSKSRGINPIFRSATSTMPAATGVPNRPSQAEAQPNLPTPQVPQKMDSLVAGRVPGTLSKIFRPQPDEVPIRPTPDAGGNIEAVSSEEKSGDLCACGSGVSRQLCKCKGVGRPAQAGISDLFRKQRQDTRPPSGGDATHGS